MADEAFSLTREVRMNGAYNFKRNPPGTNYGIHGVSIAFIVKGPIGGIELTASTDWYTPDTHVPSGLGGTKYPWFNLISRHSAEELFDSDTFTEECSITGGGCFSSAGGLYAAEFREGFLHGGTDWLWPRLEEYYNYVFLGGEEPDLTPIPQIHPDDLKV